MWPHGGFRVDGDRSLRKGLEPFKLGLYGTAHSIKKRDVPEVVGKVSR